MYKRQPHAFEMRFASSGDGMRMELFSPLDVFGEEKLLEAGRPQLSLIHI